MLNKTKAILMFFIEQVATSIVCKCKFRNKLKMKNKDSQQMALGRKILLERILNYFIFQQDEKYQKKSIV